MKKLRMLLAAALALSGASTTLAQPPAPPAPGLFPAANGPVGPVAAEPVIVIGDNASSRVPRMWFTLSAGLSWASATENPFPLLTTSDPADFGIVGAPTTAILLGQDRVDYGAFTTISFGTGGWWNADRTIGSEGMSTWSEQLSRNAIFASDFAGTPAFFRPFFDPAFQAENSFPVSLPGQIIGTFIYETRMRFNNSDSNLMLNAYRDESRAVTALVGYRMMYIREQANIIEQQTFLANGVGFFNGAPLFAGDTITMRDRIETVNWYYLAQVGLKWERFIGAVALAATGKIGVGWAHQRVYSDGRTTLEPAVITVQGGILQQRSFADRNQIENFAFVPELGVTARFRVLRRLHATASYNFLYVSDVARPGRYFDRVIETTQVPSSATFTGVEGTRPTFQERRSSDMFIHGVTAGVTWAY